MPANPTPAEGVVVPRDLLPILEQIKMLSDPKHIEPSRQALDAIWGMAHTLETALAARPAAPTQSAAQTGEVETEATDLVARLNNAWVETVSPSPEGFRRSMVANVLNEARAAIQAHATLIEAQAVEIEGLRAALEPFVQHGRACGALADADNGPFWIMTDTGHRDIPAEDFRRAFFLASRTERADG